MTFKSHLKELYQPFGNEWVEKNGFVFKTVKECGLSLAGSIAIALGRKKAIRTPGDIDLVCSSVEEALHFIRNLENKLFTMSVYWRILVNSRTEFCPDGCSVHFRFLAPFWLPICVMVIPKVKHWRTHGGVLVQSFEDVVHAAQLLDERDGKGRLDEEPGEHIGITLPDISESDPECFGRSNNFTYPPK